VKQALVRIHVVESDFWQGREDKAISFGSGCIISPDGYVITNHHVAGKALRLMCTMPNREEVPAVLVGTDPATDIAVIKLMPEKPTIFPFVEFGDSDKLRAGDPVLALGSPVALSQSVTLGIVSNPEMIMPPTYGDYKFTLDGENVGELVRWIGHDAAIFPGNSGGPLVNLEGRIIGVNEIGMGLGGAIPGNLAKAVAEELIANGVVRRAYIGAGVQPLLKRSGDRRGVLINTVLTDSPAEKAGIKPGDILLTVNGLPIEGRFGEDLPIINQKLAALAIDAPASMLISRAGSEIEVTVTPTEREPAFIPERELREWGMSARNLGIWKALEIARDQRTGVLVSAARQGGPLAKARPELRSGDIITEVNGRKVASVEELQALTAELVGSVEGRIEQLLVKFERDANELLSVVPVGIESLPAPGREVTKGWLPMETQVLTRELAEKLGLGRTTGVRVTRLYNARPEGFPFAIGDIVTHVDGESIPAARREDADVFQQIIRQYDIDTKAEFTILRDGETMRVSTAIQSSPMMPREMQRYRDVDFEFIAREAAFRDLESPTLKGESFSVIIDNVTSGGWAHLGGLQIGDILLKINGEPVGGLSDVEKLLGKARTERAKSVVLFVRRGVQYQYLELEPAW
jgi:serine protease Do